MFPDDEALRGALLPLGLHKGYGLLFAAELLAGVVGSGGTSNPATAHLDTIRNNMLSVVIDPASLVEGEWMEREFDTIVDYVTSSPPANPDEPVLVAGDPERMTMEKRLVEGIPVDPVTWDGILEAGELVGRRSSSPTASPVADEATAFLSPTPEPSVGRLARRRSRGPINESTMPRLPARPTHHGSNRFEPEIPRAPTAQLMTDSGSRSIDRGTRGTTSIPSRTRPSTGGTTP